MCYAQHMKTKKKPGARMSVPRELQRSVAKAAQSIQAPDVAHELDKLARTPESKLAIPPARRLIGHIFEDAGLSLPYLVKKLKEGLEANEVWRHVGKGDAILEASSPDFRTRQKYLEMAFRIREAYPLEDAAKQQSALVIQLPAPVIASVDEWNAMIDAGRKKIVEAEAVHENENEKNVGQSKRA